MKRITIKDRKFKPFISTPHIEQATRRIAARLNDKYKNEITPVRFVVVLNGALPFAMSLFTKLKFPVELDTVKLKSYEGTSRKEINIERECELKEYDGRKVIVVDDIIDTGHTMKFLKDYFRDSMDVLFVALLFKIDVFSHLHPSFSHWGWLNGKYDNKMICGIEIHDSDPENPGFVVGYGLDYDGLGRNLNKIYILEKCIELDFDEWPSPW